MYFYYKFKLFKALFVFLFFFIIFSSPALSAEKLFKLNLYKKLQDPQSKEFQIILQAESTITTDRARISWELPNGLESKQKLVQDVNIQKGENLYYLIVTPERKVRGKVKVSLESYESEKRFLNTQSAYISSNSDLEILPITEEYQHIKLLSKLKSTTNLLIFICLILVFILFIAQKIYLRFHPPKIPPKTPRKSKILDEIAKYKLNK